MDTEIQKFIASPVFVFAIWTKPHTVLRREEVEAMVKSEIKRRQRFLAWSVRSPESSRKSETAERIWLGLSPDATWSAASERRRGSASPASALHPRSAAMANSAFSDIISGSLMDDAELIQHV